MDNPAFRDRFTGNRFYRTEEAQRLHTLIDAFAGSSNAQAIEAELAVQAFMEEVVASNPRTLLEYSDRGNSLILDALYLPFAQEKLNHEFQAVKALAVVERIQHAIQKAADQQLITRGEYAALLTHYNTAKFTPLHSAISSGSHDIYANIASELKALRAEGVIDDKVYAAQFTLPTLERFTPLHTALLAGEPKIYESVTRELKELHAKGILDDADYARQFTLPSQNRFTPLHSAVIRGVRSVYDDMAGELKAMHAAGVIDDATYARQFTLAATGGHTPLYNAITAGNISIYDDLSEELRSLRARRTIDDAAYAAQFTAATAGGFTPLHHAVAAGRFDIYKRLTGELKALRAEGVIDDQAYAAQFKSMTAQNFTLLHSAVSSGNSELVAALIEDSAASLAPDDWKKILLTHTHTRWNLMHAAVRVDDKKGVPDPFLVNMVLDTFSSAFGAGEARRIIEGMYREPNQGGFHPYHHQQPEWLQRLLALSNARPAKPLPMRAER